MGIEVWRLRVGDYLVFGSEESLLHTKVTAVELETEHEELYAIYTELLGTFWLRADRVVQVLR
jgi:hypothetical protein